MSVSHLEYRHPPRVLTDRQELEHAGGHDGNDDVLPRQQSLGQSRRRSADARAQPRGALGCEHDAPLAHDYQHRI